MTEREATPASPGDGPIDGPRLRLRPVEERDLGDLRRWRSDPEVRRWYGAPPPTIAATREQYLDGACGSPRRYVIEEDGHGIGEIQCERDAAGGRPWSAGIDLFIGEPGARDRGLGTEAVRTMLAHLFETQRVHRVLIDPEPENHRAIGCYARAGFRADGVVRDHAFEHGAYVDALLMTILEDEWPAARARWEAERGRERAAQPRAVPDQDS